MSEDVDMLSLLPVDYHKYERNSNLLRSLNNFVVKVAKHGNTQLKANLFEVLLP